MSKDNIANKFIVVLLFIFSLVALGFSVYLFSTRPKLGYVQNSRILAEYLGIKEGQKIYQDRANALKANLDTLENEYKLMINQYKNDFPKFSDREKKLTEELIQKKQNEYVNYKEAVDQKIKEEDSQLTSSVLKQIDSFVIEYGKKNGYDYIFGTSDAGSLFFAKEKYEITDQVIKGLNDSYRGK